MPIFYGWLIVLIAFLGSFITAGTGGYIFGQFIGPLSQAFGWSVGFVSSVTFVRSMAGIIIVPLVGRITDRLGSRPVMFAGALVGGGAFLTLSVITDPVIFYIIFTVVVSIGYSMLGGIPSQAAVARWFKRRRGLSVLLICSTRSEPRTIRASSSRCGEAPREASASTATTRCQVASAIRCRTGSRRSATVI